MLGEIFGRRAGDIVAEEVPWRFLLPRGPIRDSGLLTLPESSGENTRGVAAALFGVPVALNLADLADNVGVVSPSTEAPAAASSARGSPTADSGRARSCIASSSSNIKSPDPVGSGRFPCAVGSLINVDGVAGSLVMLSEVIDAFGDFEVRGIAGGGMRTSVSGSGDTELSLV